MSDAVKTSWLVTAESLWPTEPKILDIWPFTENSASPWSRERLAWNAIGKAGALLLRGNISECSSNNYFSVPILISIIMEW